MKETLGQVIERAMSRKGLKGYQLAQRLGKQSSFVSRLINDEIKETLPISDFEALERELEIPQVVMLRAWGFDIPEDPRVPALTPEREAVLYVLDQMEPDLAQAYAEAGELLLKVRRTQTVANRGEERVPALR